MTMKRTSGPSGHGNFEYRHVGGPTVAARRPVAELRLPPGHGDIGGVLAGPTV